LPLKLRSPEPLAPLCGPDRLGTSRTIVLDAAKHKYFEGKEPALGLRDKEVILTFDDGPIAGKTSRVLKSLKEECVKATFFYVGKMARAYPKLVRKVISQGHTLAHHTHDHNRLTNYSISRASVLIDQGVSRLQKIAYGDDTSQARTPFFRYPYLARTKSTDQMLADKGMIAFGANIDALDWKPGSPAKVHDRIMRRLRKQGRGIILMHDIQARTAKMLPRLLRSLKDEGYSVVHIVAKGHAKPKAPSLTVASVTPVSKERSVPPKAMTLSKRSKPAISKRLKATVKGRFLYFENLEPAPQVVHKAKFEHNNYLRKPVETHLSPDVRKPKTAAIQRHKPNKPATASLRRGFLLAKSQPHRPVKLGSWKLRRSQWILR